MLCINRYPQRYVDACRLAMEAQLAAYREMSKAAGAKAASFEPLFFNNLALVLDRCFVHRARGAEGTDGNPLNEVRMLCNAILENEGLMAADKTIKYDAAKSVTKIALGQPVRLTEANFAPLSRAFFAEMEKRFV